MLKRTVKRRASKFLKKGQFICSKHTFSLIFFLFLSLFVCDTFEHTTYKPGQCFFFNIHLFLFLLKLTKRNRKIKMKLLLILFVVLFVFLHQSFWIHASIEPLPGPLVFSPLISPVSTSMAAFSPGSS